MSSRNHHAQELREQITTQDSNAIQGSAAESCSQKILVKRCEHHLIRWREDIYPAAHIITDFTQPPQQTIKTSPQNHFAHRQGSKSVMMSVDKTQSVHTSLMII